MKKKGIAIAIILVLGSAYFVLDNMLFYYGRNSFDLYSPLPFDIQPEYRPDFEGGFVIWDSSGFSLFGKGVVNENYLTIKIDKVVGYAFDDTSVMAVIIDTANVKRIFQYFSNKKSRSGYSTTLLTYLPAHNKWFTIAGNEEYLNRMEALRQFVAFCIFLGALFLYKALREKHSLHHGNSTQ